MGKARGPSIDGGSDAGAPRILLSRVALREPSGAAADEFPFTVASLRGLGAVELTSQVAFLVGENGSGKSTFLEALAVATRLPTVGSTAAHQDPSLDAQRRLAEQLVLSWTKRTHRGFFLRAEDFFGFARSLRRLREEMEERLADVDRDMAAASDHARGLAKGPAAASLADMKRRYGTDLDHNSHGESFLLLFRSRIVPGGLYLLDEPEAALSVQSLLALIAMIREAVDEGSQFVVATHSPILLAIPDATLISFDRSPAAVVSYEELDSVRLFRDFVQSPERFLRHLWP
jgi:predicted ATPase